MFFWFIVVDAKNFLEESFLCITIRYYNKENMDYVHYYLSYLVRSRNS
jgi:hypothetical protein